MWGEIGAGAHGPAQEGADVGVGGGHGDEAQEGGEKEAPEGNLGESGGVADEGVRNDGGDPADEDHLPAFLANRFFQGEEAGVVAEFPQHPVPGEVAAGEKAGGGGEGRTTRDERNADPKTVDGPCAHGQNGAGQEQEGGDGKRTTNQTPPSQPALRIHSMEWARKSA